MVWNEIENQIDNYKKSDKYNDVVIETALPSDRFFDIVDMSLCIKSDYSNDRLKELRQYSDAKINSIITSQKQYEKYYDKCDFLIINNVKLQIAFKKICDIYESIKGKSV